MATSRLAPPLRLSLLTLLGLLCSCGAQTQYQGREIGALSQLQHGVRGRVFAVDARTIHLHDLHYDGEGPAAYFYVGKSKSPTSEGAHRLRDERGGAGPLRKYRGESITLALPDGLTLRDVRWFAIYCDEYAVNFGDVRIPRELEYPKPAKVGALRGVHGVRSEPVVVVDAQTLLVPHFSYDGEAPDAKFWVGRGETPSPQGIRIPDENGKETPLRKYDHKTIVLTLPGELTVFDIGHFGVWCEAFTVDFGHVVLPPAMLRNVPPSLKMLGVSPQSRNKELAGATKAPTPPTRRPRPLARLDATTYRPHLRPGTGPLQALTDQPSDHSALHRRADTYTPPPQQLVDVQRDAKDELEVASETKDDQEKQQTSEPTPSQEQQYHPLTDSQLVTQPDRYTQEQAQQQVQQQAQQQAQEQVQQLVQEQIQQQVKQQEYQHLQQPALSQLHHVAHQQQSQPQQGHVYEQQRQQQELQQRVEVQAPELIELQYFPSEPEYYPQARQFVEQNYFAQQQQQQQQLQQPGPFQYRLVPFDRGFAY